MSVTTFLDQTKHLKNRPRESWGRFTLDWRDLRSMKLNIESPFVPLLSDTEPAAGTDRAWSDIIEDLIEYLRSRGKTKAPVLYLTDAVCPTDVVQERMLCQHSIAILDRTDLQAFAGCRDWTDKYLILGRALAIQLGLSMLHPYIPGVPAVGSRFFGRSYYIDQIVSGRTIKNSTIVGNRRIGKTSMLQEVKERLREVFIEKKNIFFASLYGATPKSTWDAVYLICSELQLNVPKRWQEFGAISDRYIKKFPKLIHSFAREHDATVVIFIDEFDKFIDIDSRQGYEFLHLLREMAMDNQDCYVIIAGFRRLMETRVKIESPLFNFTHEIALPPFSQEETLEMVVVPLARLGIDTQGTNLPKTIFQETRGQPELVQMYCRAIVQLYQKLKKVPTDSQLLSHVHKDAAFARSIVHTFLNNTNAYEQLICLQLFREALQVKDVAKFVFPFGHVENICDQFDLPLGNAETATLLNNLIVGSIIERVQGKPGNYRFAVPQLIRFCRDLELSKMISVAEAEARRNPPSIYELNFEPQEDVMSAAARN